MRRKRGFNVSESKYVTRSKSLLRSSPMGPCQGMSDSARAAEALMKENIVLANNLKNYTPSEHKDENKTHLH